MIIPTETTTTDFRNQINLRYPRHERFTRLARQNRVLNKLTKSLFIRELERIASPLATYAEYH
jgi:hypothetical protein